MSYFWNAVSSGDSSSSSDLVLLLAGSALKVTFLLGIVALLCLLVRRFSAATRHLLWTLSLCGALLLPFLSVIEVWEVPVLPAHISSLSPAQSDDLAKAADDLTAWPKGRVQRKIKVSPEINDGENGGHAVQTPESPVEKSLPVALPADSSALSQQSSGIFWSRLLNSALVIWCVGALLLLFRLLVGFMSTRWLTRGAVQFKDAQLTELFSSLLAELQLKGKVRLLRSERTLMPIVCGVLRPTVLLPASADEWSEERRKMVLLHELTHVTRRDCLTQMLAQTACALYWFNPFVWHAARQLRVERERACDDYVLSIGTKPSDYAHHLLEIARYLQEHSVFQWSQTTTVAMARRSQLEGRLLAILSKEGKRRAMSQVMAAGATASVLVLFLSLAVVRPTVSSAQNPPVAETANEETKASEKSLDGIFSTAFSRLKMEATMHGAKVQESGEMPGGGADAEDKLEEKLFNGTVIKPDSQLYVMAEPPRDIESAIAESAPPQAEIPPLPSAKVEPVIMVNPFINLKYQHERKPEAQDKGIDFIDEMASVGYTNLSVKELVTLKTSGVTAAYVKSLRDLGLGNLAPKELAAMCINDVTPAFIQSMRNAGYKDLTTKEFVTFSVHDITPEFINRLRTAGYSNLSAKQLTDFAVHQITPEFIASMRAIGFANLTPKDLVSLRVHDITPEFVRTARNRLGDLTVKQIVTLKLEGLIEGSGDK
jgi:beta-lactamase regulating signal transducer with metallopeptidase domain